jgi:thiol-disulfide isomerase/thioredoxin
MVYLEINKKNYESGNPNLIDKLNKHLTHKDDKIFILYFMEGCGPCNATRPEWSKLKNVLSNNFLNRDDIVIVSIDKDLAGKLKNIGKEPNSFPTIRFIKNTGKINENYEDSNISKKDRTIDSFVEWIKLKSGEKNITKSETKHSQTKSHKSSSNKTHKKSLLKMGGTRRRCGGKWSLKYKRSINCKRPKGFSQRQYCKYSRNK